MDQDGIAPEYFGCIFEGAPDWHTLKHFEVTIQAKFLLEQAQNQQEYELATSWVRLRGQDSASIGHIPYTQIHNAIVMDDDSPALATDPACGSRYDVEEAHLRDRFFSLSLSELIMFETLRRTPLHQQLALESWITRLHGLDKSLATTFAATKDDLGAGAQPTSCFRAAFVAFEAFVRNKAETVGLLLTDEAALTRSFPTLAPWVRDYIIEVGIHADDESAFVPDIERDRYFLLLLMVAAAVVLVQPAAAAQCYSIFQMPLVEAV